MGLVTLLLSTSLTPPRRLCSVPPMGLFLTPLRGLFLAIPRPLGQQERFLLASNGLQGSSPLAVSTGDRDMAFMVVLMVLVGAL